MKICACKPNGQRHYFNQGINYNWFFLANFIINQFSFICWLHWSQHFFSKKVILESRGKNEIWDFQFNFSEIAFFWLEWCRKMGVKPINSISVTGDVVISVCTLDTNYTQSWKYNNPPLNWVIIVYLKTNSKQSSIHYHRTEYSYLLVLTGLRHKFLKVFHSLDNVKTHGLITVHFIIMIGIIKCLFYLIVTIAFVQGLHFVCIWSCILWSILFLLGLTSFFKQFSVIFGSQFT